MQNRQGKKGQKGATRVLYSVQVTDNSALLEDRLVYEQIAQTVLR
jgi:hypothetical protein